MKCYTAVMNLKGSNNTLLINYFISNVEIRRHIVGGGDEKYLWYNFPLPNSSVAYGSFS